MGKTALFEPQPSLEDSTGMHPVFISLDFSTKEEGCQPCVQLPNLEDQVSASSDSVTHLCPQAPGSLFVAFYDSLGCGGGILTRLHTRMYNL
jgi:hypothetical protein